MSQRWQGNVGKKHHVMRALIQLILTFPPKTRPLAWKKKRGHSEFPDASRADAFTFPLHNTDRWTSRSGKSRVTHGFLPGVEAQEHR